MDLESIDLSVYATKTDLNDYATTSEVNAALNIYATTDAVNEAIAGIDLSVYATSAEIDETIKDLEIGGRNLLLGTSEPITLTAGEINYKHHAFTPTSPLIKGQVYSFSADVEILAGTPDKIEIRFYDAAKKNAVTYKQLNIIDGHVTGTITPPNDDAAFFMIYAGKAPSTAGNSVKFSKVKLEKGEKATVWTPAPEDMATTEYVNGSLALRIVEENGAKYSKLSADVDKIVFNTGEIEINSDKFTLDNTGSVTCSDINIIGGNIEIPASWGRSQMSSVGFKCENESGSKYTLLMDDGLGLCNSRGRYHHLAWNDDDQLNITGDVIWLGTTLTNTILKIDNDGINVRPKNKSFMPGLTGWVAFMVSSFWQSFALFVNGILVTVTDTNPGENPSEGWIKK